MPGLFDAAKVGRLLTFFAGAAHDNEQAIIEICNKQNILFIGMLNSLTTEGQRNHRGNREVFL